MAKPTVLSEQTTAEKKLRRRLEKSLWTFAKFVNPLYCYGEIHKELFDLLEQEDEACEYLLALLPRGHLKSHCVATYVAWKITKKPWTTFVYLTAGEDLATIQMTAIKNIFDSEEYRLLWPEMFHEREALRNKWSTWAINTDHPERIKRRIRDYTVIIKTIGSSATGLHCDELILDDVVVQSNAYSETKRKEVELSVADYAAIKNTGALTKTVGTRYHEKDIYAAFIDSEVPIINEDTGEITGAYKQWKVVERKVETQGDGLGHYLWPRVKSTITGDWYGFDFKSLVKKRAEYAALGRLAWFYAQYYNETNHTETDDTTEWQYYNRKLLQRTGDIWYYNDKQLNIVAGIDVAWTDAAAKNSKRADYTAIAVVGMDEDGWIYILDLVRFRTDKYSVYYGHLAKLYDIWRFRKAFIETESAGKFVYEEMASMIRQNGLNTTLIGKTVPRNLSKEERHAIILEPRYISGVIKHYKGGLCPELELEVSQRRPKFDDLKDATCTAIKNIRKPMKFNGHVGLRRGGNTQPMAQTQPVSRFGGRRR